MDTATTRRSTRSARVGAVIVSAGVALASIAGIAGFSSIARADTPPAPITDYATYPADLPAGCPDGGAALTGVSFTNGRGGNTADLRVLDVRHGDTVTMSWSGFAAGCTNPDGSPAIAASLAAYHASGPIFDVGEDMAVTGWVSCGAGAAPCTTTGGHQQLQITLPASMQACNVQLDAVLGLPLGVVGPSGSYYSPIVRGSGPNLLVSAANFGLEPCVEGPPTTPAPTTVPPTIAPTSTEAPPTTMDSTTTTEETTTTTSATTTTEETTTTMASGGATPAASGPAPAVVQAAEAAAPPAKPAAAQPLSASPAVADQAGRLPFTGADTIDTVALGFALAGMGALLALSAGLWRHRRQAYGA